MISGGKSYPRRKLIGQMNLHDMAVNAVRRAVAGDGYSAGKELRQEMAKMLIERIEVSIKA